MDKIKDLILFILLFVVFTPVIGIVVLLIIKGFGYNQSTTRGIVIKPIKLSACPLTQDEIFKKLLEKMPDELRDNNVPAKIKKRGYVVTTHFFIPQYAPMLLVKNTELGCKYFELGVVIDKNTLYFPLFGNSKANFNRNRNIQESVRGTLTGESSLFVPGIDHVALEREQVWQESVIQCVVDVLGITEL